jgi:tight adherence protein C
MSDPVLTFAILIPIGFGLMAVAGYGYLNLRMAHARHQSRLMRASLDGTAKPPRKKKSYLRLFAILGQKLRFVGGGNAEKTADFLASAGFGHRDALLIYAFAKTMLPVTAALLAVVFFALRGTHDANLALRVAIVAGAGLAAARSVDMVVNHYRNRRLAAARLAFPDMLELFVIASEAGLALQPALTRVAGEMQDLHPVLAKELILTTSALRLSHDRKAAFDDMTRRLPLTEIGHFAQTLLQAERHGTPFSTAMRVLMRDQRADRLFRIEEKAARLPVLMTIPLIALIMPAVFVVLIGPAVLSVLDNIIRGM